jgi:hypothetical protein
MRKTKYTIITIIIALIIVMLIPKITKIIIDNSIDTIPGIDIVNPIPILIKIAANIPNINLFNTIQKNTNYKR